MTGVFNNNNTTKSSAASKKNNMHIIKDMLLVSYGQLSLIPKIRFRFPKICLKSLALFGAFIFGVLTCLLQFVNEILEKKAEALLLKHAKAVSIILYFQIVLTFFTVGLLMGAIMTEEVKLIRSGVFFCVINEMVHVIACIYSICSYFYPELASFVLSEEDMPWNTIFFYWAIIGSRIVIEIIICQYYRALEAYQKSNSGSLEKVDQGV